MASTDSRLCLVSCPQCGARFQVDAAMAGRRGKCGSCGAVFKMGAPADQAGAETTSPQPAPFPDDDDASDATQYIGFACHLCSTRMYARPKQMGQEMKCPDCGARTVVPPPPKPKKKNIPEAMEGEQYELWEPEAQPLPSALLAAQPKYIAVPCKHCDTLIYATDKQIGEEVTCPDCGKSYIVPAPPKPKPKRSVVAGDAPLVDVTADPGERPAVMVSGHKMMHEERQDAEYAAALEKSKRTGKPMEIDSRGRPVMPAWPLISGILPFLFSSGVVVRWLAISLGLVAALSTLLSGIAVAMQGGFAAVAGMCVFAVGCVFTALCAALASSMLLTIVAESSEGAREVGHWPGLFDSLGGLAYLVIAAMVSAIPGWAIEQIPGVELGGLLTASSILFLLPIVLISQLDNDSPFGILSARILASIAKCPASWLLFYLEIGLLAAICGAPTYFIAQSIPSATVWLAPLYFAAAILFARLLGRLGWRLADAMAIVT
jgi:predicted Zn finger-like uncharacterized protein